MKLITISACVRKAEKSDIFTPEEKLIPNNQVFAKLDGQIVAIDILHGNESMRTIVGPYYSGVFHMLCKNNDERACDCFKLYLRLADSSDILHLNNSPKERTIYYIRQNNHSVAGPFRINEATNEFHLQHQIACNQIYVIHYKQRFEPAVPLEAVG